MKKEICAKLKELGVSVVYIFGSEAVGKTTALSDRDIGIVLKKPAALQDTLALYKTLYGLFAELYPSQKLDIVFLQTSPIPLQYNAMKEGKILFEQDPRRTADYEEYITDMYLDFKPVLEYFDSISSMRYAKA
ncbi:MAG: nucleotidyltransferase domain-containing protein [Deltaproteobacteria bacterium]|nr:nucleotidyltransferase domain-containing protein [Deltaproteobacteria bacterium]